MITLVRFSSAKITGVITVKPRTALDWITNGIALRYPALDRKTVVNLCFKAIHSADLIFAWIDSEAAYGTWVELGYALGLGKLVYVCFAPDLTITHDMWFAATAAHRVIADNPRDGLAQAVQQVRVRMRRN